MTQTPTPGPAIRIGPRSSAPVGGKFEYSVRMTVVASVTAALIPVSEFDSALAFFDLNFLWVVGLWIMGVVVAARTAGSRLWDTAMVAIAAGVLVSFDLNYRAALWSEEEAGEAYLAILPKADVVFAGDEEAAIAVGPSDDPMELAHRIAELGPRQVIIKLGDAGAVALIDGNEYRREAIKVPVVDTVGAGDAFVAGYIAELLNGLDPHQRLETAVRTGAFACMVPGDWEGMPRRNELGMLEQSEPVAR
ncbi:PfkB family carbohydrate kinase [Glutamicibacter ardleyensis]|uniref:PfkB family carbohydrate kinase n=1 Tax=Glutamicibacter ardleyensis TaxID=225894 RepID=UPI003FD24945